MDWDELDAKYGGGAKASAAPLSWDELDAKYSKPIVSAAPLPEPVKKGTGSAALDSANAVGTGFWRGMARYAGLPVDTVLNVLDLAKAGAGSATGAVTGHAPPDWLGLTDRSKVVGSGQYIEDKVRGTAPGRFMVDPANPDYEGGYLQNTGGALAAVSGGNPAQIARSTVGAVTGANAGKLAYDATGNEALAITAGMSPQGTRPIVAGVKAAVRGGEAGRQQMVQRIADLKAAGVDNPSLGLASGNQFIGGVENLLQNTPGAVGVMKRSRDAALQGLQSTTDNAANLASPTRGALASGTAIQSGIGDFRNNFKAKQGLLYDALDEHVPPGTPSGVGATMDTLAALNAPIPGAPNTSKLFRNARIGGIFDALSADLTQPKSYSPSQLAAAARGEPQNAAAFNGLLGEGKLPYEAVKKTRTLVGNEIADSNMASDVPRSKWNPLYGALSSDLQDIAAQSGPGATKAFNRATDYTRAGMDRLDRLEPFTRAAAPEQAFSTLTNTLGENVSTLQAVKKSLPEGARGTVAGTVIERLGKATSGKQNDTGSAWSPETFLTNWNRMTPQARGELFSGFPNAAQVSKDVESVARATSMMRDNSKMWANPSGSGANIAARSTVGALAAAAGGAGLGLLNPLVPLSAAGGLLSTNGIARSLTSKGIVDAMAQRTKVDPRLSLAQFKAMLGAGLLSEQPAQ